MLSPDDAPHQKPLVFISHIHEDAEIAYAIEQLIKRSLLGGIAVFNTSNRASLRPGDPWRDRIVECLRTCVAALIVATPGSVNRPWVNFESGGAWIAERRVIPCCASGMTKSSLPAPLNHLHSPDLTDPNDLRQLIGYLAREAKLDEPTTLDYGDVAKEIESMWVSLSKLGDDQDISRRFKQMVTRPNKYAGETLHGVFVIIATSGITPIESKQLPDEDLIPGDSIHCDIQHHVVPRFDIKCFATGAVADTISDSLLPERFALDLRCVGQTKVIESPFTDFDEPDRGIEYRPSFVIDAARRI